MGVGIGIMLAVIICAVLFGGAAGLVIGNAVQRKKMTVQSLKDMNGLRDLIENVPSGIGIFQLVDNKLKLTYINAGYYNMLGADRILRYEMIGYNEQEAVHINDMPQLQEYLDAVINDKLEAFTCEYRVLRGDNQTYMWIMLNAKAVFAENGDIIVYCVFSDSNEQHNARMEAERQYAEQMQLMNAADDVNMISKGVHNLTKNRTEYFYSLRDDEETHERIYEQSFDQLTENLCMAAIDKDMQEELMMNMNRQALINHYYAGKNRGTYEYQQRMLDGSVIWVNTSYNMFLRPESNEIICFTHAYDITNQVLERKIVERLTNVEYDFLALLDVSTNSFVIHDVKKGGDDFGFVYTSQYEDNCVHFVKERIRKDKQQETLNNMRLGNIIRHLRDSEEYAFTYTIQEKDGTARYKKLQYSYLDGVKDFILFSQSDITQIYNQEQAQIKKIEQALLEAKLANEAKTEFLSRMSHDIRTPMNGIIGITQLALSDDVNDTARDALEKIYASSQFLLGLVNDILDMTKVESGSLELKLSVYTKKEFANYINAVFTPLCQEKQIAFHMDIDALEDAVMADSLRVNQIFFNLLSNAVKYTQNGGRVDFFIENVYYKENRTGGDFVVRDNGRGMSEEFQKHMYEAFSQEQYEFSRNTAGLGIGAGLGLAIVKKLVDLMEGTISVKSTRGKGSEFRVQLEFEVVRQQKTIKKAVSKASDGADLSILVGKRILLCEDHPLNKEISERFLMRQSMMVESAENGKIGLDMFAASEPGYYHAILMDIQMPVMNGLEATEQIRSLDRADAKKIPIIAMTANAFSQDVEKTRAVGMVAHLAKPVVPQKLYETLALHIGKYMEDTVG